MRVLYVHFAYGLAVKSPGHRSLFSPHLAWIIHGESEKGHHFEMWPGQQITFCFGSAVKVNVSQVRTRVMYSWLTHFADWMTRQIVSTRGVIRKRESQRVASNQTLQENTCTLLWFTNKEKHFCSLPFLFNRKSFHFLFQQDFITGEGHSELFSAESVGVRQHTQARTVCVNTWQWSHNIFPYSIPSHDYFYLIFCTV